MGATIYYRRVAKNNKSLHVRAPSSFMEAVQDAFGHGGWPMPLGREALPVIKGMIAADKGQREAYQDLYDKIEENDEIEIWPEW